MDLKKTSTVPMQRLTQRALLRHERASAAPKLRTSDTLPSTEIPYDTESLLRREEADQIILDPKQRQDLLDAYRKDAEVFGTREYPLAPETNDLIDTRPADEPQLFLPPTAYQIKQRIIQGNGARLLSLTPGPRITPPTVEAGAEESPQQSINSVHESERLIKTTFLQEGQLQNTFPSHFPQFQHVQNHKELEFYIDRSEYAINVGSGALDDLRYGIIIVPLGEEHMLFRSEHVSQEAPLETLQEASLRAAEEVQPAAPHLVADLATVSKIRAPAKRKRNGQKKPSRVTKATKTRHPQPLAPTRRSERLNDWHNQKPKVNYTK